MFLKFLYAFFLALSLLLIQACAPLRSVQGPMQFIDDRLTCSSVPSTLIVMLPGAYDKPQDFIDHGFVAAVRSRRIDADIRLVDAHISYYTNQQIEHRLEDEIVAPARARGYKRIWFAGISLGGYGTLLYSAKNPSKLDGFFVMAPYMGSRNVPAEVQRQGGLRKWSDSRQGNIDIDLWRSLQGYVTASSALPPAYLGFGQSDRFAEINALFADVLPRERSFIVPGGHDWSTWKKLWAKFLDAAPLPRIDQSTHSCTAN